MTLNFDDKISKFDVTLRPAEKVMRLSRLGSFHQSRLSFLRILLRRISAEKWKFSRKIFEIGDDCSGTAVYTYQLSGRAYSLIAFAHKISDDERSDRVIATKWDSTFTLFDGIPSKKDINRLKQNVPNQEAGRVSEKEITLSRANKSVRLWDYVVNCLSNGQQPDIQEIEKVGYMMRTTAVYGSGKFGAVDYTEISNRPEFGTPFQAEMLTVYMIRAFVIDLLQHAAKVKNPNKYVQLDPKFCEMLGVGNSTGLGMAPFLINHPQLLNNWISAKEKALARIRGLKEPKETYIELFKNYIKRSNYLIESWNSKHELQALKLDRLRQDKIILDNYVEKFNFNSSYPFNTLYEWAEKTLGEEAQELLVSLILEPFGELIDDLSHGMSDTKQFTTKINGSMLVGEFLKKTEKHYAYALKINWNNSKNNELAWYVSEEKLEPRLGNRFKEEGIEFYEQPLQPSRDVARMHLDLSKWENNKSIAEFLMKHPEHRHIIRRCQIIFNNPYAEIQDNTISSDVIPIDLLRAKLSFFGAFHFDPRSDRWVRINMFKGAPLPQTLDNENCDNWTYPEQTAT